MVKRVRGTVRYHEENDDGEFVRVTSEPNAKLSDLPKEVQEQEQVQELVYDDKNEDDESVRGHSTQVTRTVGSVPEDERREAAAKSAAPDEEPKSKSKSKDS